MCGGSRSAPRGEQREPFGGDPVDLGADITELLAGHRPGLYPRRDALRDYRGLEVRQRDPGRQIGQVGAGVIAGLASPASRQ